MSLSIAINQIQRPTWWYENDQQAAQRKKVVTSKTAQIRQDILAYLKESKCKVSGANVQRHFGLTNAQLWHYLGPLVDSGQVKKTKPGHNKSLLEAV